MMSTDNTEVLVAIAKLDGKLALALAEISALKANDADHEVRIRTIEAQPIPDTDTQKRLKTLEVRRTVSPAHLWLGLISALGVTLTIMQITEKWSLIFGA